ncbi:hypothetical protein B5S32_g3165 [[Candida] boidinii]|nr:hypothetical protein B5S32_g3165 [[Candida] boidinii]
MSEEQEYVNEVKEFIWKKMSLAGSEQLIRQKNPEFKKPHFNKSINSLQTIPIFYQASETQDIDYESDEHIEDQFANLYVIPKEEKNKNMNNRTEIIMNLREAIDIVQYHEKEIEFDDQVKTLSYNFVEMLKDLKKKKTGDDKFYSVNIPGCKHKYRDKKIDDDNNSLKNLDFDSYRGLLSRYHGYDRDEDELENSSLESGLDELLDKVFDNPVQNKSNNTELVNSEDQLLDEDSE